MTGRGDDPFPFAGVTTALLSREWDISVMVSRELGRSEAMEFRLSQRLVGGVMLGAGDDERVSGGGTGDAERVLRWSKDWRMGLG